MNQKSSKKLADAVQSLLSCNTELLSRIQAKESLLRFTEYTNPLYQAAGHHRLICDKLEAVERGEIDRLMIFMPPRHGKSELASRRFPAWYIGRNPSNQIITASYGADLATDFGREVRNIVSDGEYGRLFETRLREDSRAANRWNTDKGGSYVAVGIGGAVTGRGANVALIDDPFKDRQDADSEVIRERVWAWYQSTLYTRLMPGGAIILIQTRWHEDDLAGRLLELQEKGGDQWEILELPAEQDGEALWPDWYPIESLHRIKAAIGPREYSALYQQNPQPDEGTYFKREWFRWYNPNDPLKPMATYMAGDFAVTEGDGDYTEIGVCGVTPENDLYIAPNNGWWSGQTSADQWIDCLLDLVFEHEPYAFVSEKGVIRNAIEPYLDKRSQERSIFVNKEWLPHIGDKAANARAFQARCSSGKVYLPDNELGHRILGQLLAFPAGKYDDIVDVLGLTGRYLQMMVAGAYPKPKESVPVDRWGRRKQTETWKTL